MSGLPRSPSGNLRPGKRTDLRPQSRKSEIQHDETGKPGDGPLPQPEVDGVITISAAGDIVVDLEREEHEEVVSFRVHGATLKSASPYFERLLDVKYQEGSTIVKQHEELLQSYARLGDVPVLRLPRLKISYLGQTSVVKTIRPLMTDFLNILHGQAYSARKPPLVNLANLVVVADRFNACPAVARWASKRGLFANPAVVKTVPLVTTPSEESVRQRLLIGMLLEHGPWVSSSSAHLILNGSTKWSSVGGEHPEGALWWDLPGLIEDELQFRRTLVLSTLSSLVTHHLTLFTSRARQCRLCYDTSPQCDSFQLGEFVRFLARYNLLRLQTTFHGASDTENDDAGCFDVESSDILAVIKTLRQCPSYQLDAHHSHCGPRQGLLQGLDLLTQRHLVDTAIGVCLTCWRGRSAEHVWSRAVRPLRWGLDAKGQQRCGGGGGITQWGKTGEWCAAREQHDAARAMFLAVDRDWGSA